MGEERRGSGGEGANGSADLWLGPSGISGFGPELADLMVFIVATEHLCTLKSSSQPMAGIQSHTCCCSDEK